MHSIGRLCGPALFIAISFLSLSTVLLEAQDWPGWRGPNRDGSAPGVTLPASLPSALDLRWKAEVGEGYSGPVTSEGKVIVFSRRGEKECLAALDESKGKELWKSELEVPFKPEEYSKSHGKGPFATPTIARGKVYVQGITGTTSCHDLATGTVVWRKEFEGRFKKTYPMWGSSASPLIEGGLCVVWLGTEGDGALAAFRADTGESVWIRVELEPSYSSPVAADLAGVRQIVALTRTHLVGVDPTKGSILWKAEFKAKYEQNIVTPIVKDDLVFVSGYEEPTLGVRVAKRDGGYGAEIAWKNEAVSFFMCSPIPHGDSLIGVTREKKGALVSLAAADGKLQWTSAGGLGEYVSVVVAGDRLLALTTSGELLLVDVGGTSYRELSRTKGVGEGVWSHLAVTKDLILVKDKSHLSAWALPRK